MSLVLRKIRKAKWYKHEAVEWLPPDRLQADTLSDLQTKDNALSIYLVQDDKSDLERVIAALAAACDNLSNFDYALFDDAIIREASFKIANHPGETPDQTVNVTQHRDLIELTTDSVLLLARAIRDGARERKPHSEVGELITRAVAEGHLTVEALKPELRKKLALG